MHAASRSMDRPSNLPSIAVTVADGRFSGAQARGEDDDEEEGEKKGSGTRHRTCWKLGAVLLEARTLLCVLHICNKPRWKFCLYKRLVDGIHAPAWSFVLGP